MKLTLEISLASEACKTALEFLKKIPVYVMVICRTWVVNVVSDGYFSLTLEYYRSH